MTDSRHARLRRGNLAFFGKIVAGQSHEVTNILNIINEVAGLQADFLHAAGAGGAGDIERLGALCEKVQAQVARGEQVLRNINRFAHSVDKPLSVFDAREALANILFLSRRWTNLRKVELTHTFPDGSTVVESSPFLFQQAVFLGIDLLLERSDAPSRVSVGYRVEGEEIDIDIEGDGALDGAAAAPERDSLEALMEELGGSLAIDGSGGRPARLTLKIPLHHHKDGRS